MTSGFLIRCCVSSCNSNVRNSHMFPIPKDVETRDLWLHCLLPHNTQLGNLSKLNLIKELVCSKHFEKEFLADNGKTLLDGCPSLFSKNEILLGVPLGTETDRKKGDHTYSKPPDDLPRQLPAASSKNATITSQLNVKKKLCNTLKVNPSTKELSDREGALAKEEIILLDHEEFDELTVGPMAPLAPLVKKKQIEKHKTAPITPKECKPRTKEKGPFKCEYCGRWFQAKHLLIKHQRMHTNERPHICDICNRGFNQLGTLNKHKQTHNDDRPYMCNFCGKDFKYKWYFKEHLRSHDSNRHLICEVCSKTFAQHASLWMHMRTHHTVNNTCDICNENFPNYYKLQKHKLTHTNQPAYKCSLCQSTYSSKSYLKVHLLRHKYE